MSTATPKAAAPKPKPQRRARTGARVAAVQALFNAEASGESVETVLDQFVRHRLGPRAGSDGFEDGRVEEADVPLFVRILRGAATEPARLDEIIVQRLSANWSLQRLDPVLRALLRAAAGELRDPQGPPAKVVITEYLDVAHGFFSGEEPRFANGVLDAMARSLRAGEF